MKRILFFSIFILLTSCGHDPTLEIGDIILPQGDLFIASHETEDHSFLYQYQLTLAGFELEGVNSGKDIEEISPVGLAHSIDRNELYLANSDSVVIYHLAINGSIKVNRVIQMEEKSLQSIKDIAYYQDEIYVLLGDSQNSVLVFDLNDEEDSSPIRLIKGDQTGIDLPTAIVVSGSEIFVVNTGNSNSITVYNVLDKGDVLPLRSIVGLSTGINNAKGIAVNSSDELIYISNGDHSILSFKLLDEGNIFPKKRIQGSNTYLHNPGHLIFDPIGLTLIVCNDAKESILTFPIKAEGNLLPSFILSGIEAPKALTLIWREADSIKSSN